MRSIEAHIKTIGSPYRWCQMLCGLFYETKSDRKMMIVNDRIKESSNEPETHLEKSIAMNDEDINRTDSSTVEMEDEDAQSSESNEIDDLAEVDQNETKLFEQIINRLKTRFKARLVLQETINSLSNFISSFRILI